MLFLPVTGEENVITIEYHFTFVVIATTETLIEFDDFFTTIYVTLYHSRFFLGLNLPFNSNAL